MLVASGNGEKTTKLFVASDSPGGGGGGGKVSMILVSAGGGVDLGAVGRALGLDPSSVRLNGHFVSRGPDLVSSLTWGSLLSFFNSRGLQVGASELDPVVVQGKPTLAAEGDHLFLKRRVSLEDEPPLKRNRVNEGNLGLKGVQDSYLDDDGSYCIRRKLKLEDDRSSKKRKITDCSSGLIPEPPKSPTVFQKVGSSFACLNGHGKRLRQDDFVPAL